METRKEIISRANWVRASVLGANDGIVSIAALVVGVASAYASAGPIVITGIAGLIAGSFSMATGEYVSVSSQRDLEKATHEERASHPADEAEFTNPWEASIASAISYTIGGIVPLLAVFLSPIAHRVLITFIAVIIALIITGYLSAKVSKANPFKVVLRTLIGGMLAMLITSAIGTLVKGSVG